MYSPEAIYYKKMHVPIRSFNKIIRDTFDCRRKVLTSLYVHSRVKKDCALQSLEAEIIGR